MNSTVDFEDEAQFGAIEVDGESIDGVLAAELEAEHLTIAQETPGSPLHRRGTVAELAGSLSERELDRVATDSHGLTVWIAAAFGRANCCDQSRLCAFPLSLSNLTPWPPLPVGRGGTRTSVRDNVTRPIVPPLRIAERGTGGEENARGGQGVRSCLVVRWVFPILVWKTKGAPHLTNVGGERSHTQDLTPCPPLHIVKRGQV